MCAGLSAKRGEWGNMRDLCGFNILELFVIRDGMDLLLHTKGKTDVCTNPIAADIYRAVKQEILRLEMGDILDLEKYCAEMTEQIESDLRRSADQISNQQRKEGQKCPGTQE